MEPKLRAIYPTQAQPPPAVLGLDGNYKEFIIMKWFLKCLKQYVDFKGRARRREYWMFALFLLLIQFVIYGVIWLTHPEANPQEMVRLTRIPQLCVALVFLLPNLTALTRRLHDIGESGGFLLPVLVLSWGTLFLPELINESMCFILLYPVAGVLALLFLIKLVRDGQPGMNYLVVETPEGNFCKDIQGFYQE